MGRGTEHGESLLYGAPTRRRVPRKKLAGVEGLLEPLQGRRWEWCEFEKAVIEGFNERLSEFPPHYGYREAISWGEKMGWIRTWTETVDEHSIDIQGTSVRQRNVTFVKVSLPLDFSSKARSTPDCGSAP